MTPAARIKKDQLSLAEAVKQGAFPRRCPRGAHRLESAEDTYTVPNSGNVQCRFCRAEIRHAYRATKEENQ